MSGTHRQRASVSPARRIATTVLHRVVEDGAYASRVLDAELSRERPDVRDARLAAEIVYGSLRTLPTLDRALERYCVRGRPEPYTWAALRAAAYQALHLSRVPDFAIAQQTVSLVRSKRGEGLSRLTNAVLRKLLAQRPADPQPPTELSVPDWVRACLERGLGTEPTARLLHAEEAAVPLSLRAVGVEAGVLAERLGAALPDASVHTSRWLEGAVRVRGGGDPRTWPGYDEGGFVVQDEGAQAIAQLVCAQVGDRVWDACAGRGGKALQLAHAVGANGTIVASDLYEEKLRQLQREAARLNTAAAIECHPADLRVGAGDVQSTFDRVLVDAPCTGLGTIRRRPEILLRLEPTDPARMAELQLRLLRTAAQLVRPGGRLVFATCSPTHEEGPGVIAEFQSQRPEFQRIVDPSRLAGHVPDSDGIVRFGPWLADGAGPPDVYQTVCWDCT